MQSQFDAPRLDPRLAGRLDEKKRELDEYRPLPAAVLRRLGEELRVSLTYHSNAIEGNTLSLRETALVLEEGITIGGHTLREHLEARNHAAALDQLSELVHGGQALDMTVILELHRLVMKEIDDKAGQLRDKQVYIRGASFTPPPARQVEGLVYQWLEWVTSAGLSYPPIVRVAVTHHDFEAIHPFFDGNGRTGRLLLNLLLMQEGYPPAMLLREWRTRYLEGLARAGQGNYRPLVNIIGRAVEGGLDLYLEAVRREPNFIYQPIAELAGDSQYSVDYLGWLLRQGRLDGIKRHGHWYSTPAAIEQYQAGVDSRVVKRGRPKHGDATGI